MPNPMAIHDSLHAVYATLHAGNWHSFSFVAASIRRDTPLAFDIGDSWAIVSARNPMSEMIPERENLVRDGLLDELLRAAGIPATAAAGQSVDGSWREPGRALVNINRATALDVARRFEQRAIVWGTRKGIGILDCLSERWIIRPIHGIRVDRSEA